MGAIAADVRRGALIVLEGLDRSGKSSQCSRLTSFLHTQGLSVEAWRFPDRSTAMGKMISSYLSSQMDLDDASIHLLFSANRWEKRALMEAKLRAGTTLVVDRYSYSGVAFSAAKGLDLDWCKAPEAGLPAPDLVLYLDISAEAAAERGGYGGERYEKVEFQKKVEQNFKSLQDSTWQNIDATQSIDTLESMIREAALKVVNDCHSGRELSHMWPVEKSRESPH
ncbi:unnamed protein product [Sphagnum jensenii]|uniref:dTMP kinase n=2 Tax=Sphagnum jensenii TaxID=128206 RepID=A0ABP0VND7_9BRYO